MRIDSSEFPKLTPPFVLAPAAARPPSRNPLLRLFRFRIAVLRFSVHSTIIQRAKLAETNDLYYFLDKRYEYDNMTTVMTALSLAPAPTSGVRWTDLPIPFDSTLPSCCLSYKQSAFLSPLCFHNLTNHFSRKSFPFTYIQNRGGVTPPGILFSDFSALWLSVSVANPAFLYCCGLFCALCPLFRACVVCFQRLTASFRKTPGGGGLSLFLATRLPRAEPRGHSPLQCAAWESTQCLI